MFTSLPIAIGRVSLAKFRLAGVTAVKQRQVELGGVKSSIFQQHRYYAEKIVKVPQMAESISEGTLKQFSKQVGDFVKQDEEVATIETDKIDVTVNAPDAGKILEFLAKEEDTVSVGQDLLKLELGGASKEDSQQKEAQEPKKEEASKESKPDNTESKDAKQDSGRPKDQPSTKGQKEAKDSKDEQAANQPPQPETTQQPSQKKQAQQQKPKESQGQKEDTAVSSSQRKQKDGDQRPASAFGNREEKRVKMNRMRLRIAERLKQSQNTAASLTTFNEVDMSNLMEMRSLYKESVLKKTGVKLGFMSAFARAVVLASRDISAVNASIEGPNGGDTIVYRDYMDLSVAVATPKGLVTPVVRNVESLDFLGIEKAIAELGAKARDGKLTIEDMAGGTFTISNGGVFGSLMGTPIINLPQTAVLGLHAVKDRPMAINELTVQYDHRLLDGREAVTFVKTIKELIEDPRRMLLV